MKKAVFFDVDGTLFHQGRAVPKSTIEAIRKIRENGHLAFICTGRSRIMIPDIPIVDIGFDGIIAACGMYASYENEVLFDDEMSEDEIRSVLPCLHSTGTMYILEGTEYIYYDEETIESAKEDWYIEAIRNTISDRFMVVPKDYKNIHACKISMQLPKTGREELFKNANQHFQILLHTDDMAEFVLKGYSKAEGIRRICEKLNICREDTIAVGDSINDVDMLLYANVGVAMGDGTKPAKECADYITTGLNENGVYNAMQHLGLL